MLLDNSFRPDLRVLREAKALTQAGLSVTIVAWDRDEECDLLAHEIRDGFEVVRVPVKSKRHLGVKQIIPYLRFAVRAIRYARRQKIDIVHCHDLPDLPIGVLVKILKRVPLIYDAHEIYWIMDSLRYPKFISNLQKIAELALLKWVDVLITVGEKRVQYYRPHFRGDIYLVGNYYDPQERDPALGRELRQQFSIPAEAFVVAYAGTLSTIRGIDIMIECADRFRQEAQNVHFVFAGVGAQEAMIREAADRNPLVHFMGWVSDLRGLFSAADVLTYLMKVDHPYTQFNAPNNLYLSIAWKIPLLAVQAGEIDTVITNKETGILLDKINASTLFEAIKELASSENTFQHIVSNLSHLQEIYSWKSARDNLYKSYQAVKYRN